MANTHPSGHSTHPAPSKVRSIKFAVYSTFPVTFQQSSASLPSPRRTPRMSNDYNTNDDDYDTEVESFTTDDDDDEDAACTPRRNTSSKTAAAAAVASRKTNESVLNFAFVSFVSFLSVQAVFALIAHSQSMLADCEAMSVDALTYLFNLWAERAKTTPLDGEQDMNRHERRYHRELRRLYLELIPPAISCSTLIGITMFTLRDAFATLLVKSQHDGKDPEDGEDVSVVIMMIFSSSNLLLDIVNVTCFARSSSLFGLQDVVRRHSIAACAASNSTGSACNDAAVLANETTPLKLMVTVNSGAAAEYAAITTSSSPDRPCGGVATHLPLHHGADLVNLNMCSAWTVRFFSPLAGELLLFRPVMLWPSLLFLLAQMLTNHMHLFRSTCVPIRYGARRF
jgi:hypothetical protein